MNKETPKFDEQSAPEKNTDAAFVKVGADGKPVMPEGESSERAPETTSPKEGTLADR